MTLFLNWKTGWNLCAYNRKKAKSYLEFYEEKRNLESGLWLNTLERSGNVLREQEEKTAIARNQEEQVSAQLEEISREIEMSFNRANSYTVQMDEIRTKNITGRSTCSTQRRRNIRFRK